ncbi:M20/M25/M40 family metallo-hydrolase, partial [Clostridium sp.]
SHGAYPQEGCNAVEQAMALTGEIETYVKSFTHPVLGASTAQVTQISGGVAPNMTPDTCRILMDIRMTPGLTSQMVVGQAEAFAAARSVTSEEKFRVSCRIVNDRRAIEIGESHPLVKQLSKGLEKKGLPVETTGINFFTDASILVEHKLDAAVLLFGPGEAGMAHKPNERVEIEKYQKSIQVLMDLIASEVDE